MSERECCTCSQEFNPFRIMMNDSYDVATNQEDISIGYH